MPMARYQAVPAELGWAVIDTHTDRPVEIGSQLQVDLSETSAIATASLMNNLSTIRHADPEKKLERVLAERPYPRFSTDALKPGGTGGVRT